MPRDELLGGISLFDASDIELGGDELELGEGLDLGDSLELGPESQLSSLDGELDLDLEFGGEDGIAAEDGVVLEVGDIADICNDYYQNIREILERMAPPKIQTDDDFTLSPSDFKYLNQQEISTISKAMLEKAREQKALPENKRMSSIDAAEEIFDDVTSVVTLSVGVNYRNFIETCARLYENFFKRASAASASIKPKFVDLVDKAKLAEAEYTLRINGPLWHQISLYLGDGDSTINRDVLVNGSQSGKIVYYVGIIGSAMEEYNAWLQQNGRTPPTLNTMRVKDLLECVQYTLSRVNMMQTLHISEDEVSALSIGELLRRYTVLEIEEGLFEVSQYTPSDIFPSFGNVVAPMLERVNVQFDTSGDPNTLYAQIASVYSFLCLPYYREGKNSEVARMTDSITWELLWYICVILMLGGGQKDGLPVFMEYLKQLTPFMTAASLDAPYIRPVMYYTPSPVGGKKDVFELNFCSGSKYFSVEEQGLLVEVVGDNRQAYLIPEVRAVNRETSGVKCTDTAAPNVRPNCVVLPLYALYSELRQVISEAGQASKKGRLSTSTEYIYRPSLSWVVNRSYSSQHDVEASVTTETVSNRTSNPLLLTLIDYTNDFEPEVASVDPGVVSVPGGKQVMYLRSAGSNDPVFVGVVSEGSLVASEGTLGFDEEDGSLILKYYEHGAEEGTGELISKEDYTVREQSKEIEEAGVLPTVQDIIPSPSYDPALVSNKRYLRAVNKHLCKLNALEYEEELEDVRRIIASDLCFVIPAYKVDGLLAIQMLPDYEKYVDSHGTLEHTNFESLRELSRVVLGAESPLEGKTKWDDECAMVFERMRGAQDNNVLNLARLLDQYDTDVIALHGLSNNQTSNPENYNAYCAMLCIPWLHHRLRDLEERMLLLRILEEIGTDIAPILRKRSPMLTTYTKITTSATIDDVENSLKSGMHGGKKFDALPLTRKVLNSEVGGSTPILKYFALERNVYGIMATAICSEDEQENALYLDLQRCLGLDAEGMMDVTQLDEKTFMSAPFAIPVHEACARNRESLLRLIERGILADTSARIDIRVIKAYDLLCSYGDDLFDIAFDGPEIEDFSDTSECIEAFYTYAGSFLVGYCLVDGQSLGEVEGAKERLLAFRENSDGFCFRHDLTAFAQFDLYEVRGNWCE